MNTQKQTSAVCRPHRRVPSEPVVAARVLHQVPTSANSGATAHTATAAPEPAEMGDLPLVAAERRARVVRPNAPQRVVDAGHDGWRDDQQPVVDSKVRRSVPHVGPGWIAS